MSQWIMWEVSALFENIGTVYDGMGMMTKKHDIVDRPRRPRSWPAKGAIAFERIRFHYGKSKGVIDNLSLDIKPGEKIGLVGRSGAGKTTLMNLLLRFYDLEGGRITIDGQDISAVSQDSLRSPDRRGDAGYVAAAPLDPRQHRLWPSGCERMPR